MCAFRDESSAESAEKWHGLAMKGSGHLFRFLSKESTYFCEAMVHLDPGLLGDGTRAMNAGTISSLPVESMFCII